jgi:hypothetical protein
MRVGMNNSTKQQLRTSLCAGLGADCEADADNPRKLLRLAWSDWIANKCQWKSMITLTVDNDHQCERSTILKRWLFLNQVLNRDLYGKHYLRKVGHSYFNYIVGVEYTKIAVVHLHVAVDMPINFQLVHSIWNAISGFAYIKPVTDNVGVADYICKYILKQDDLVFGIRKEKFLKPPAFAPLWYIENLPDGHPHKQLFCVPSRV